MRTLQNPLKLHVFVCQNERPAGHPRGCCKERGSEELLKALKVEAAKRGLTEGIRIQKSGCLDVCEDGAALVVYSPAAPEGVWLGGVKPDEAPAVIDKLLALQLR